MAILALKRVPKEKKDKVFQKVVKGVFKNYTVNQVTKSPYVSSHLFNMYLLRVCCLLHVLGTMLRARDTEMNECSGWT